MAVSPGVQTEFWEFPTDDFCLGLHQWSSNLTAQPVIPLVHSISYGFQGNLSKIHCQPADAAAVDSNLAKLAAKGITVVVSSGDAGSGYTVPPICTMDLAGKGRRIAGGAVAAQRSAPTVKRCCTLAAEWPGHAAGWTFVAAAGAEPGIRAAVIAARGGGPQPPPPPGSVSFDGAVFHNMQVTIMPNSCTISAELPPSAVS